MKVTTMQKTATQVMEQQMLDRLAKEMQQEIDSELMADMLVAMGWTKIELPPFQSRYHSIDILTWVEDNCHGQFKEFKQYGRTFVFKEEKDASLFALKWL